MQIVIDIPEEDYKQVVDKWEINALHVIDAILTGTPLPKGHGRLIDADALEYTLGASDRDIYVKCCLDEDAPTIIEADKEEQK